MFVFRKIWFFLILKYLVVCTYSETEHIALEPKVQEETLGNATKLANNTSDKIKEVETIIGEGGEKLPSLNLSGKNTTDHVNNTNSILAPTARPNGREGIINRDNKKNESLNVTEGPNENKILVTHIALETIKPVTEKSFTETSSEDKPNAEKPPTEMPVTVDNKVLQTTHNRIVPKKGVDFNDTTVTKHFNTTNISRTAEDSSATAKSVIMEMTTKAEKIHKPTVTIGSEDNKDALPKEKKSSNSTPKVPTIEYYQKKKEDKRSTFIIPIIAVIFSVPLVAIILNVLYKRCKEWWSHRHYRRMDFLIDGMYNN